MCSNITCKLSTGTQYPTTHKKRVTQFQGSDLENDNIIFRISVPTFESSRCGLPDRFLIFSRVYFLSARDQIDQRQRKKKPMKWQTMQILHAPNRCMRSSRHQSLICSLPLKSAIYISWCLWTARPNQMWGLVLVNAVRLHFNKCSRSKCWYFEEQGKFRTKETKT